MAHSGARGGPRLMKAGDLHAQNKTRREKRQSEHGSQVISIADPLLDRVRPEVRDEALRLQRRLQQLVAEGDSHAERAGIINLIPFDSSLLITTDESPTTVEYDKYNDTAPLPFDVRVNNKVVEVLAPVEPKNNGKKYSAARKSAFRWQPLPPRQAAQLSNVNTPSIRKARQEHHRHLTHPTPAPQRKSESTLPGRLQRVAPEPLPRTAFKPGSTSQAPRPLSRKEEMSTNGSSPPHFEGVDDEDEEDDEDDIPIPHIRRKRRQHPQLLFNDSDTNGDDDQGKDGDDDGDGDDDDDEIHYSPVRRRSKKAPKALKSMAQLTGEAKPKGGVKRVASPVLFPASRPPPKLFTSTQELRKGYEAVAEEKEKVHPTFDLLKTHPIDRHVRLINTTSGPPRRQNVKPLNMRVRQSLQKPMPAPTTGPRNFGLQLQPQVPDVDSGEEAYRGRVYRTIEKEKEFGRGGGRDREEEMDFRSLFGDTDADQGGGDDGVVMLNHSVVPVRGRDLHETYLPRYMAEAEADPYGIIFETRS
ncbi:MAG: hypothetical protein M1839_004411 [Geoglossum umbratile]|nr:MAG: hypothetical protein M1839_004411 [Geoglossum umbratile]